MSENNIEIVLTPDEKRVLCSQLASRDEALNAQILEAANKKDFDRIEDLVDIKKAIRSIIGKCMR